MKIKLIFIFFLVFFAYCSEQKKYERAEVKSQKKIDSLWDCGEFISDHYFNQFLITNQKRLNEKTLENARKKIKEYAANEIIFVENDNESFPLWYLQEVENLRKDLQIVNTSLLNEQWYIDHLKRKGIPDSLLIKRM